MAFAFLAPAITITLPALSSASFALANSSLRLLTSTRTFSISAEASPSWLVPSSSAFLSFSSASVSCFSKELIFPLASCSP